MDIFSFQSQISINTFEEEIDILCLPRLPTNPQNTLAHFIFSFCSIQSLQTENMLLKIPGQKAPTELELPSLLYCLQLSTDTAHTGSV